MLSVYKKNKDANLINMILFLTDYHFYIHEAKRKNNLEKTINDKSFVIKNINEFIKFNLNQTSLINSINNRLSNG